MKHAIQRFPACRDLARLLSHIREETDQPIPGCGDLSNGEAQVLQERFSLPTPSAPLADATVTHANISECLRFAPAETVCPEGLPQVRL